MLKQRNSPSFLRGIIQRFFRREELLSPEAVTPLLHTGTTTHIPYEHVQENVTLFEAEMLLHRGYTMEEMRACILLRDRYQHGGSDRGPVLRHLEFLKLLVQTGKIER